MSGWPAPGERHALLARMRIAARRLRLPLRGRTWRGDAGNWAGAGVGASIDFQDHRPYVPGDDPRYIDWQAYARSGHYTMKLYREEVSPRVDVAFDVSASMAVGKGGRSLEILYFAVESALQSSASLRCHAVNGPAVRPWATESLLAGDLPADDPVALPPAVERVPWRQGSLRVWISDLLFPGGPEPLLGALAASRGRGVVLVPFARGESDPDWRGNVEIEDAETGSRRLQQIAPETLARYRDAYARHFALWAAAAQRHGVALARVAAEPPFVEAVQAEALRVGALEVTA